MKLLRLLSICVLALAMLPAQARAHTKLVSSTPAQGDTVREPVSQILLGFSEAIAQDLTTITILDANGREIGVGVMVHPVGTSPSKQYMVMLAHPLVAGSFTVKWKTAGEDGHVVAGMFDFVVDAVQNAPVSAPAVTHPPEHAGHHADASEIPPLFDPESSLLWVFARWLNFMGLLLVMGAVAFRFGVLERAKAALTAPLTTDIDAHVRRLAVIAAAAVIISNILRLWLQLGSLHGPERMLEPQFLSALLIKSGWGKAWIVQTIASIAVMIAAVVITDDRLDSWFSVAPFAIIAASMPAFSGHAAAVQQMAIVPILDDAIHVLAASSWLGTLMILLIAGLPRVIRTEDGFTRAAALVHAFSPLALVMASITVLTGAFNAFVHIATFSEFWTTDYGRVLAVKIGVVIITATMGAYNWRVVRPRLGAEGATAHIRKSAASEAIVAVIIIVITAVLVGTPTN